MKNLGTFIRTHIFLYFLILAFIITNPHTITMTWAGNKIKLKPRTICDLKQTYPQAIFQQVSVSDFNMLIAQLPENSNPSLTEKHPPQMPDSEILTAGELSQKYPALMILFHRISLDHLKIKKAASTNQTIIILYTDQIDQKQIAQNESFFALAKAYPDCQFQMLYIDSEPKLETALKHFKQTGITYAAQVIPMAGNIKTIEKPTAVSDKQIDNHHDKQAQDGSNGQTDHQVSVGVVDNSCISGFPDLGDGDAAVVVFVLVGVFVAAVLIVYAGKYIYDAITKGTQYEYWWETTSSLTLFSKEQPDRFKEKGTMAGIRILSGIKDDFVQIGLAGEIGWLDSTLYTENENKEDRTSVSGAYGMIGPAVRLILSSDPEDKNPSCFIFEVLAGAVQNLDAGLLSSARAGIVFGIMRHWRIGAHIGSIYFNLNEKQGLAQERDNFRLTGGVELGYRF